MQPLSNTIREYLRANNFYAYELLRPQISANLMKEYEVVADIKNKRNLLFDTPWENITSFGSPRKLVVIDLGGTNLSLFDAAVTAKGDVEVFRTMSLGFYEDTKIYTPESLFTDLKKQLDTFLLASDDRAALKSLVFIFSFPLEQLKREDGYIDAVCTYFGKMRESEGIIGLQVGKEFQEYLRHNGYPSVSVSVTNDTPIYCLAAKAYQLIKHEEFDAGMNIIVGTGSNISGAFDWVEQGEVKGLRPPRQARGLRLVNTEFGDFKGVIPSRFDDLFNKISQTPDRYLTEKMLSGAWLHQILKVIMSDLLEQGIIDADIFSSLPKENLNGETVEKILKDGKIDEDQKMALGFVWREINKRGGAICGIMLAVMMKSMSDELGKKMRFLITETGSVLHKGVGFRESLIDTLDSELGRLEMSEKISYKMESLQHQSAYGAAIFDAFFSS